MSRHRSKLSRRSSRSKFRRGAINTHPRNSIAAPMRGGIRL